MGTSAAVWLVLVVALVAVNLPFMNERLFVFGPRRSPKSLGWRALELVIFWLLALLLGFAVEARIGQRHVQAWEFYAAFGFLCLTFAFPGFIWRYLRRHASPPPSSSSNE